MKSNYRYLLISLILLLAALIRLWNLEWNPAWYTDEGTHIEIAQHLLNGENGYLGITESYLIAARLPLFEHLLAFWFRLVGVDMFNLRVLTSFMGIITTALAYRVVKDSSQNTSFAVIAMALFAVYPQAVIYSRFGFSYNLLPILILGALWSLIRYQKSNSILHLLGVCGLFGLGTLSDFIAFSFVPSVLLIVLWIQPRHIVYALLALVAPFLLHSLSELSLHSDIFLHDLTYNLARAGGLPFQIQFENLLKNVHVLLTETWWIMLGVIGFLFIQSSQLRWMVILLVIPPLVISGRTIALYHLTAYYMIPFLPFFSIGLSALLVYGGRRLTNIAHVPVRFHRRVIHLVSLTVIGIMAVTFLHDTQNGFLIGIEEFLIESGEAHQVRDIMIDYAKPRDVVIVSPTLAWMFDANVTDYQLSSLSQNVDGVHFPASLYPDRFAFEVNFNLANYAIVDNLWRDWGAVHMPTVEIMLEQVQTWELIFQSETIQIYHNSQ